MITARLINSEASLNNFFELESVEYVPGEDIVIAFRLYHRERGIRYIPPAAATLNVIYVDSSSVEQTVAASVIDADDRSMWKVTFSDTVTDAIGGMSLRLELDRDGDSAVTYKTVLYQALSKQTITGSC